MQIKDERTRRSLRYSVLDGAAQASMLGFGESFFSAFAVFLRATNLQIGLLTTLPQAVGALLQLASNRAIRLLGSRKRLVASAALLPRLREVKKVKVIPYPRLFFKVISTMPASELMLGLIPFRRKGKGE